METTAAPRVLFWNMRMSILILTVYMRAMEHHVRSNFRVPIVQLVPQLVLITVTYADVVSAPDPNQPQRGSLPVSRVILDAIRAGVGLGLAPRLLLMWYVSGNHPLAILCMGSLMGYGRWMCAH